MSSAPTERSAIGDDPAEIGPDDVEVVPVLDHRPERVDRDIAVDAWADLREVREGEACPSCGRAIEIVRCIEAGHIFKLGTRYSEAMGATVLDPDGIQHPIVMGSYGIGVARAMATVAETSPDANGIIWPTSVAPFEVVITIVSLKDEASVAGAETLYRELSGRGVDVLLDDRDARAGVKFADAELIGIPHRVTFGPKAFAEGEVILRRIGADLELGGLLASRARMRARLGLPGAADDLAEGERIRDALGVADEAALARELAEAASVMREA